MKSRIINRITYIEQYVVRAIVLIMEQIKHIDKQMADGTGRSPQGEQILIEPININKMIIPCQI